MTGQDIGGETPVTDPELLAAAARVLAEHGYRGLTLDRLAGPAATSRMTLHRRGVSVRGVVDGLTLLAVTQLHAGLLPALTGDGHAAARLNAAVRAVLAVADEHLPLLAGLYADDAGVFHAPPGADGRVPTHDVFVAPFARLLRDGALDGSLRGVQDPVETATALFNLAGWGYVQLRHAHRWSAAHATDAVLALVLQGLLPR